MLPPDVNALLELLSGWATLGFEGIATTPLECAGLSGFRYKLLFYMSLIPIAVVVVICLVTLQGLLVSSAPLG